MLAGKSRSDNGFTLNVGDSVLDIGYSNYLTTKMDTVIYTENDPRIQEMRKALTSGVVCSGLVSPLVQAGLNKINDLLMLGFAVTLYGNRRAELKMDMPVAVDRTEIP